MENRKIITLYYKSGSVRYIGTLKSTERGTEFDEGIVYREDRKILAEGVFQRGGLLRGEWYYPNGQLMFSGAYNLRDSNEGHYYGPPYPKYGKFYAESGEQIYDGKIIIRHRGGVGYPYIVLPTGLMAAPGLSK